MMRTLLTVLTAVVLTIGTGFAAAAQQAPLKPGGTVAFLGMIFQNTSLEPTHPEEQARVLLLDQDVLTRFAEEGLVVLSNDPIAEELANTVNPANCYGCDLRMATKLGADYLAVGQIVKISNLILSVNLVLKDVATGDRVRGLSVDIRSNSDDSWQRGLNYILKNNFFKD